jgi:hypothetical protein
LLLRFLFSIVKEKTLIFQQQNPSGKEIMVNGEPCTIYMQEIAGLDEATNQLIYDAEGIVYFYNIASRSSCEQIEAFYNEVQKIKAASTPSALDSASSSAASPPPFQMFFVGIFLGAEREVSFTGGNELARKLGCNFYDVPVETEAVGDILPWIIRSFRQARKAECNNVGISLWNWNSCLGRR